MKGNFVFRLDAGINTGFGHLSRCLSLAEELLNHASVTLIVKSDSKLRVENFIQENSIATLKTDLNFLSLNDNWETEMKILNQKVVKEKGFLILDHYKVNETYQLTIKDLGIKWLQFDSHANQKFYGNIVLHASPGADTEKYTSLAGNADVKFLLGPEYAIINKKFSDKRKRVKAREKLNKIFVCFGGGDDGGVTYNCLRLINKKLFDSLFFHVFINTENQYLNAIRLLSSKHKNIKIHINTSSTEEIMANCDAALIAPGTLSYESSCLGLPMILITLADNQNINAIGWESIGAGINLGEKNNFSKEKLNTAIELLINDPDQLWSMSNNCLSAVDGFGAMRVTKEIISIA